jgi:3-oxoacyl-[acyl-carrier protein] reductase
MIEGLKDKVVIVTGGGHGIGRAYCHGFGVAGAKVVVVDIDAPAAEKVAGEIVQQFDGKALAAKVDVANEASTKDMAKLALDKFSRIDILINNAAIFATIPMNRGGIDTIDPAEWDRMMAVNLKGLFFCCRAVLPAMRRQKSGKIINISSGTALNGSAGRIHYVTSKAGVIGFTRTLAREVGDDNINVNAIAPGSTLSEDNPSEEVLKMRGARVGDRCLKRVQLPKDLVGTMLFLASPLSDFMTGQTVAVDGVSLFYNKGRLFHDTVPTSHDRRRRYQDPLSRSRQRAGSGPAPRRRVRRLRRDHLARQYCRARGTISCRRTGYSRLGRNR